MFVRHRKRTPGPSQAKSLGPEVDDTSNAESGPRSTDLAVDGNNSKQLLPPPSPHEYVGPAIPAEAGRFSHTGKGTAPREIQSATQSGDTAAAAAAAANGKGSGKPPLGQPPCPPGHNRSQEANRLRTSRGSRLAKAENCTGANTASGKQPPPQSQPRKSQSSGSASSSSKGAGSDAVQINPRTELYAALAAFQSELGEQQQVTIISQLGAGAHGVVYRGEWRGLEVAIKTLFFQAFVGGNTDDSGNSLKEQAILEAAIATTLFHPNVINTFSYDIKPLRMCPAPASSTTSSRAETLVSSEGGSVMDWKLYIIQEYCDGGTLKDALDGARFTDPDTGMAYKETAVRVAIEIALGMSYIHGRNIIHGDLKPANILLRSNGASPYGYTAKIADFGLALKLKAGESHISNIRRGTPLYIASELVEDGRATTASDLYSFGVILWELLHGCTVARRLPLRRRIPNLPMEFYTWPPDCPPAYRELATACLSSNPASRPRFVDALPILNTLLSLLVDARLQEQQLRHQQQEERRRLPVKAAARVTAQECKREDEGQGQAQAASSGAHSGDKEGTLAEPDGVGCAGGAASGLSLDFQVEGTQQPNNPHPSCKQLPSFAGAAPSNPTSIEIPDCAVYKQSSRATTKNLDADNGVITGKGLEPVASAAIAAAGRGQASLGAKAMVATGARDVAAACVDMQVEPTHAGNVPRSTFAGQDNVDAAAGRDRPDKGDCADARSGNAEVAAAAPEVGASYGSHTGTGSQTEGYAPVGDARPMALRALVHTASAEVETVAEAEAVKLAACRDASMHGGGNAGGVSPSPGGGTISLDDKAQSGQPILGGQQQPSSPGLVEIRVPPNPNGVAVGLTAVCIEPSPAVADSDVHMHAGKAVEHSNPITDNAHANQHANLLTSKHASRQEWRNTTVFPTTVAAATAFLAAQPAAETPVPTTAAATAAVLAALAGSITNTRTLDNDIGGMLDSCLGSTDGRAMERGLMLDLMPALSNQPHSSHISSSLSPDLAVALEKMLGMHGIRRDAAPVLEPADMATSGTETCESGGRLAVLGRQG
ncbi:hypothetical protein Vretifemale_16581 [Volvox reticuliferus]|nr:hypothetical protein Vretifemale_16581 [Volvox reticuliferus]